MRIHAADLTLALQSLIGASKPVLITSEPGVGKTSIVKQVCETIDRRLVISHPPVDDPTDAKGLPCVIDGKAVFQPLGQLAQLLNAKKPTVWLLDDIGQATAAVQASYMQWLLAREVAGHRLPDCVSIVAASNRRTDRAGVSGILEPVKSRFHTIFDLEADVDSWSQWAIDQNVNPLVIAWARFKAEPFQFLPTADLTNCCMPRTLANAADILSLNMPSHVETAAVQGAIGEGAATELLAFIQMANDMPSIDRILLDPKNVEIPKKPAVLYSLSTALAARTTKQNFGTVTTFLHRMVDAAHGEFAVLALRDMLRRDSTLTQSHAYVKLATSDLGQLLSGR